MNEFVGGLMERLRAEDVNAVLVKGQGIAQCYERPLWREAGDVDLLLDAVDYVKAKEVLSALSDKIGDEMPDRLHMFFFHRPVGGGVARDTAGGFRQTY